MNEKIVLHRDSLNKIEYLLHALGEGMKYHAVSDEAQEDLTTIANTIAAQRSTPSAASTGQADEYDSQDAIALMGLPGAGKSYIAEKLAEVYDAPVVSMGDAIRENAPDGLRSKELGKFAADTRAENAETIPEWAVDLARGQDSGLIIIDGVRSVTDYSVLRGAFRRFYLLDVRAPFYTRLDRLTERGREGEDEFTAVDLAERDENELQNLGVADLRNHLDDGDTLTLQNDRGEATLRLNLSNLTENNLPFSAHTLVPLLPPVGRFESST